MGWGQGWGGGGGRGVGVRMACAALEEIRKRHSHLQGTAHQ